MGKVCFVCSWLYPRDFEQFSAYIRHSLSHSFIHSLIQWRFTACLRCVSLSLLMQTRPSPSFLTFITAHTLWPLYALHCHPSAGLLGPSRTCACDLLFPMAGTTERAREPPPPPPPPPCGVITGEPPLTASRCCFEAELFEARVSESAHF